MTTYRNQIKDRYFDWLYNYVCKGRVNSRISYRKLFTLLHNIDFDFYIHNDVNRAMDGIDLRNRFAAVIHDEDVTDVLDDPCSVLEMILALAIRCEETIMDDPRYGDRTSQWFWDMLNNLGIGRMTDDIFDAKYVTKKIYIFMERQYDSNGKGGLFYIPGCKYDLRSVEIWSQLCWYLDNFN